MVYIWLMKTTTKPERFVIAVAGKTPASFHPNLPQNWHVQRIDFRNLLQRSQLTPITIVEAKYATGKSSIASVTRALADQQQASGSANLIVICDEVHGAINDSIQLLQQFPRPERVSIMRSVDETRQRIGEFVAKYHVLQERENTPGVDKPRPSPIDHVREIVEASNDLREENGNLSAKKIADLFGLSLGDVARWLGGTRQALSKTPDADSLQDALGYFERIARLRTILTDAAAFRKWLRIPNPALDGKRPIDFLKKKLWQELADFVDDTLTGSPG